MSRRYNCILMNEGIEDYQEMIELIRPYFPQFPGKAYAVVAEMVGPVMGEILLQLLWRGLELEGGSATVPTVPYMVHPGKFNLN